MVLNVDVDDCLCGELHPADAQFDPNDARAKSEDYVLDCNYDNCFYLLVFLFLFYFSVTNIFLPKVKTGKFVWLYVNDFKRWPRI